MAQNIQVLQFGRGPVRGFRRPKFWMEGGYWILSRGRERYLTVDRVLGVHRQRRFLVFSQVLAIKVQLPSVGASDQEDQYWVPAIDLRPAAGYDALRRKFPQLPKAGKWPRPLLPGWS